MQSLGFPIGEDISEATNGNGPPYQVEQYLRMDPTHHGKPVEPAYGRGSDQSDQEVDSVCHHRYDTSAETIPTNTEDQNKLLGQIGYMLA